MSECVVCNSVLAAVGRQRQGRGGTRGWVRLSVVVLPKPAIRKSANDR